MDSKPKVNQYSNKLIITLVILFTVITLAVLYFILIYTPQKDERDRKARENETRLERYDELRREQLRIDAEAEKEEEDRQNLLECLKIAFENYTSNWNAECEWNSLGKDNSNPEFNCLLPVASADRWDQKLKEANDQCNKLFN